MKLRGIDQVKQWCLAIICGFFIMNAICFLFERPVGWIDTTHGASLAIRRPGAILVHGTEGYGITRIDSRGYTNPDKDLGDEYILIMGSSHTQGKEIPSNKKYSILVNDYLDNGRGHIYAYNIAADGNFLPSLIKHFNAAVAQFPDAAMIVLEIGHTDYSIEELKDGINQVSYDPGETAQMFQHLSKKVQVKNFVKEYFPMVSRIKNQLETAKAERTGSSEYKIDLTDYEKFMNHALKLIRSQYGGPIVFLYHPSVSIRRDGTLTIDYDKTWDIFQRSCFFNNINLIDVGPDFSRLYFNEYKLPYGFSNTTLGSGHLNTSGHIIMADALIEFLEEQKR